MAYIEIQAFGDNSTDDIGEVIVLVPAKKPEKKKKLPKLVPVPELQLEIVIISK